MGNFADALRDLANRDLIIQTSSEEELPSHLHKKRVCYCGFDPSADSLHVGSLVPLLALRRMQLAGHRPILLLGGGTGQVGDPSFKAEQRELKPVDEIALNTGALKAQVENFLDFECGEASALIVDNAQWLGSKRLLPFLREVGSHFSIHAMLQKEAVKKRIQQEGEGISFAEFSYALLQAFDFAQLHRLYGCTLQLGGSDQWGNIVAGIDLTRKLHGGRVFGLTLPLITKADGSKFGKSESGTVWLDEKRTSPYAFYQFWLSVDDADVYRFLRYFSFLSIDEIDAIERGDSDRSGAKEGQRALARHMTELVHGATGARDAAEISQVLFAGDAAQLDLDSLRQLENGGMPILTMDRNDISLIGALVESGLARTPSGEVTTGQARKLVAQNSVAINGRRVTDAEMSLTPSNALHGRYHIVRRGKKQFLLLCWMS